jgi:hypothetical protein
MSAWRLERALNRTHVFIGSEIALQMFDLK